MFEKLRGDILSALFVHNKNKNLIESANTKVRANVPNSGSLISTANLRGYDCRLGCSSGEKSLYFVRCRRAGNRLCPYDECFWVNNRLYLSERYTIAR